MASQGVLGHIDHGVSSNKIITNNRKIAFKIHSVVKWKIGEFVWKNWKHSVDVFHAALQTIIKTRVLFAIKSILRTWLEVNQALMKLHSNIKTTLTNVLVFSLSRANSKSSLAPSNISLKAFLSANVEPFFCFWCLSEVDDKNCKFFKSNAISCLFIRSKFKPYTSFQIKTLTKC